MLSRKQSWIRSLLLFAFAWAGFAAGAELGAEPKIAPQASPRMSSAADDPFSSEPDFLPVHEAYVFSSRLEPGAVIGRWDIADGYYLYHHAFGATTDDGAELGVLEIPEGLQKHDEFFGDVEVFYGAVEVRAPLLSRSRMRFQVTFDYQGCADKGLCYPPEQVTAAYASAADGTVGTTVEGNPAIPQSSKGVAGAIGGGLVVALLSALLGGLILNLMPCVFPVLSIKALSLAGAHSESSRIHHATLYTLGVVATFLVLGGLLAALRAAGESVGWGFQLQTPAFVVVIAVLFFVLGLNLLGLLEVPGFGIAMERQNAFATGVLAVVVATPCVVPFMGGALGYGLSQPAAVLLLVMVMLGLGLALPYVLITVIPFLANRLPRPGAWMNTFKQFMAFPFFLTTAWLVWVLARQAGAESTLVVLCAFIVAGFLAWLGMNRAQRMPWVWASLVAVTVATVLLLPKASGGAQAAAAAGEGAASAGPALAGFDMAAVERRVAAGQPVFLNFTAAWCLTCLANDQSTLSSGTVQRFFADHGIAYVKGDWTNADPAITEVLERFGRSGVPLYLYLPVDGEPVVLPQLLTPGIVIDTIAQHDGG